jgi:uncharacterized protein (TIGR02118 family)
MINVMKVVVLYGQPTDPEAFEDYYASTHVPLVGTMPRLQRFEASRVVGVPEGGDPPFYRIAELSFASQEDLETAMGSQEGQATAADVANFATGGATILIAQVD